MPSRTAKKSNEEADKIKPPSLENIAAAARTDIRNLDKTFNNFMDIVQIVRNKTIDERALEAKEKMVDALAHPDTDKDATKRDLLLKLNYDSQGSIELLNPSEDQHDALCDLLNAGLIEMRVNPSSLWSADMYVITAFGREVAEHVIAKQQADQNELQTANADLHASFLSHLRSIWHGKTK